MAGHCGKLCRAHNLRQISLYSEFQIKLFIKSFIDPYVLSFLSSNHAETALKYGHAEIPNVDDLNSNQTESA